VGNLQAVAPGQVENFRAATKAMDENRYGECVRLFDLVLGEAPEFIPALRRSGLCLAFAGKRAEGIARLEQAVQKQRTPDNLISLAQGLAGRAPHEGTREEKERALAAVVAANQAFQGKDDPSFALVQAHLALELNRAGEFRQAARQLARDYGGLMETHLFLGILANFDGNTEKAEKELEIAKKMGLSPQAADQVMNGGSAKAWIWARRVFYATAAWIAGLFLLFVGGKYLSAKTLQSIENADPNAGASGAEASLRRRYRVLVEAAGIYYYISQPFVVILVIAVAGSVTYAFLALGRIPAKLLLLLLLGAVVTIYKMIQSLFLKVESEESGRLLKEEEAPQLWAVVREVAAAVGTRAVDEIRLTPGTDMAVYERGSFQERRQDRARRVLLMGVGLLHGFRQSAFKAVLAHEYGHFSHRDTAGGDVALRVNQDMVKFYMAMVDQGQAVWWNIAFQFLRIYHFLFRRISHGATRLQEVLADRVASRIYGGENFEQGLTHVIRRSVEFHHSANREIAEAIEAKRPFQDLYSLETPGDGSIEAEVEQTLSRPTSEDDTHPGPQDRFRLTRRVACSYPAADIGMVWDLFADPRAITREMSQTIESHVRPAA
jgi:Zn-dependent protease with chaperone function/tetratricopeptide (TPR) repeat protein